MSLILNLYFSEFPAFKASDTQICYKCTLVQRSSLSSSCLILDIKAVLLTVLLENNVLFVIFEYRDYCVLCGLVD